MFLKRLYIKNWLKKLMLFRLLIPDIDSSYFFFGQNYSRNDGSQNYLIFQSIYKTLTMFAGLQTQLQNGNLKGCQIKRLSLLLEQIIVYPQNLCG